MPVTIGGKPESSFADPVGLLVDCHRCIERFLSVLVEVSAQAHGSFLTSEQQAALETALRYFREAAPKHTADEEQSLFPRLRSLHRPELKSVLEKISLLENDHSQADRAHADVDRLGRAWLASGSLAPADAEQFSRLINELAALYREHIAIEERELLPRRRCSSGKDRARSDGPGNAGAVRFAMSVRIRHRSHVPMKPKTYGFPFAARSL